MSNLHEIPGHREMKLPERARWGTFCAMEQQACDLLVTASRMLAGAEQAGAAGNAVVAVRDGKILETGSAAELEARWKPAARRDLGNVLLMPGLVNAHTHVPMTFLRGFADDLPLMEWLTGHIFPVEGRLTDRIVSLGARLGMYEMMRTGTTAFVDSYLLEINVLREAERMGMRCVGGEALFAFPSPAYGGWDAAEALYREQAARFAGRGRVQVALMPHSVYTTSDDVLRRSMKLAEELDLMLHIHLSESAGEVEQCRSLHGDRRPVAYARDMGLLNERTVLAHMVDVTDEELELVASSGAAIAHNPVSNLKLASGFARVRDMVRAGISVSLGTDGACSNNSLDMFETMKLAAILAKGCSGDATAVPAVQALNMATAEGARIFRTPGLGTLAPGAPADMIALDMDEPNLCPIFNEVSHAVYAASGKDCVFTMVEGNILYDHGTYTDGLYADTAAEMRDLVEWVKGKE